MNNARSTTWEVFAEFERADPRSPPGDGLVVPQHGEVMEKTLRQRPQFRVHHQVGAQGNVRRLDEEAEGKARLDFEPLDPVPPSSWEQDRIGLDHRGAGR